MDMQPRGAHRLRKGRFSRSGGIYFVTFSTFRRLPKFADFQAGAVMSRHLNGLASHCDCGVLCWVVMPDHVHVLVQLGEMPLSRVIGRLKSLGARGLHRSLGSRGRVWSRGYYDHALRRDESVRGVSDYIIHNPVRAGLVALPGDYPFWNANWL